MKYPPGFKRWTCPVCTATCTLEAMQWCAQRDDARAECGHDQDNPLTLDVVGLASDHVFVADWKFGHAEQTPAPRNWQLRIGALAAALVYGKPAAKVELIKIRDAESRPWQSRAEWGFFELSEFEETLRGAWLQRPRLREMLAQGLDVVPHKGPWCRWCPAMSSCSVHTGMALRLATAREPEALGLSLPLTDEQAAKVWLEVLPTAQKLLDGVKATILDLARHRPIDLGNGTTLGLVDAEGNEKLRGEIVHQVVAERLGRDAADRVVQMTATKKRIGEVAGEKAARGEKGKVIEQILGEVRTRGGAFKPRTRKVKEYPTPPKAIDLTERAPGEFALPEPSDG